MHVHSVIIASCLLMSRFCRAFRSVQIANTARFQSTPSRRRLASAIFLGLPREHPRRCLTPIFLCRQNVLFSSLTKENDENPTAEWKGSSHSTSEFVTHVLIESEDDDKTLSQTVGGAVEHVLRQKEQAAEDCLSAREILDMGSVWYLPVSAPRDPSMGIKPTRLSGKQYDQTLQKGDYLRVHHHPRRFKTVYEFDWSKRVNESSDKPGVIVDEDANKGWLVIDKPPRVPVHMTVDNCLENVQACLLAARQNNTTDSNVYVTTPQRLDQNTSGLLVVATTPHFAAYFAQLLRNKTSLQLRKDGRDNDENQVLGGIHKVYKCLVCIQPPWASDPSSDETWSVGKALGDLQTWAHNGTIIRHYLEPSIRAPKNFVNQIPDGEDDPDGWLECLLSIRSVGPLYSLRGNKPSQDLANALWTEPFDEAENSCESTALAMRMPKNCQAVTEVQVELLTGRTHQIRGQLASMGYALVGDVQYGGAEILHSSKSVSYERLALQCCQLDFVDPDLVFKIDGRTVEKLKRSDRWNKFTLDRAWWTPLLDEFDESTKNLAEDSATTGAKDTGLIGSPKSFFSSSDSASNPPRADLLPDRVQLSPGKNKYVLVRASHPQEPDVTHWFVKSASPTECGGPYHGNVAQDLREWIAAAGYDVVVTGGGRIDYSPEEGRCVVYGFSYGFGKGDHALAARIIRQESNGEIAATYDDTEGLY